MQPMALSVGVQDVPADHRGRVIGLMSTGGSSLLVFRPLIASVLLSVGSWRLIFVVNLPVVLYVIVEMVRNGPITPARGTSFPVRSTAWLLLALSATVLGISQLESWGLAAVGVLLTGLVVLAGFVRPSCVVPTRCCRSPTCATADSPGASSPCPRSSSRSSRRWCRSWRSSRPGSG